MKELFPGVYQINIALKDFGPGAVNLYLIHDHSGLTLIDTGWDIPESVESLRTQLAETGFLFADIKTVLLTHCHTDHLGMINRLKSENQAKIYLHHKESEIIQVRYTAQNDYWKKTDEFLVSHGIPMEELSAINNPLPELVSLTPPDVWLEGGEKIPVGDYNLQVINTPGHSPGHTAYYEPRHKFIFSGDVLLPTIATNAATHIQHMINPLQQYLETLKRLNALDISMVLPGHEYPFSAYRRRIAELVAHHHARSRSIQQVFQAHTEKMDAFQVARRIGWTTRTKTVQWEQLKPWDKRLAMMQSVAHLELLVFDQKLIKLCINGKIYYQPFHGTGTSG